MRPWLAPGAFSAPLARSGRLSVRSGLALSPLYIYEVGGVSTVCGPLVSHLDRSCIQLLPHVHAILSEIGVLAGE